MSTVAATPQEPQPRALDREEARNMFDRRAHELLDMSGAEFIRAWEADKVDPDDDRVIELWMILPFGR